MNRDDYLEDEWPEESPAKPEAPAEEEESDRGCIHTTRLPPKRKKIRTRKRVQKKQTFRTRNISLSVS